ELTTFESLLANHPEARAEIDSIRKTAVLLETELGAAPEAFGQERRAALEELFEAHEAARPKFTVDAPRPEPTKPARSGRAWLWVGVTAIAAALPLALAIGTLTLGKRSETAEAAKAHEVSDESDIARTSAGMPRSSPTAAASAASTPSLFDQTES